MNDTLGMPQNRVFLGVCKSAKKIFKKILKKYLTFLREEYIISLVLVRNKKRTFSSVGRAPDS